MVLKTKYLINGIKMHNFGQNSFGEQESFPCFTALC